MRTATRRLRCLSASVVPMAIGSAAADAARLEVERRQLRARQRRHDRGRTFGAEREIPIERAVGVGVAGDDDPQAHARLACGRVELPQLGDHRCRAPGPGRARDRPCRGQTAPSPLPAAGSRPRSSAFWIPARSSSRTPGSVRASSDASRTQAVGASPVATTCLPRIASSTPSGGWRIAWARRRASRGSSAWYSAQRPSTRFGARPVAATNDAGSTASGSRRPETTKRPALAARR